jgi:hypothetical protein
LIETPSPQPNAMRPAKRAAPAIPDMKATTQTVPEPAAPASPTRGAGFVPDQSWVGRYVYSSDGKELGKIAAVNPITPTEDIYFDMGGFLGIGSTRKYVAAEQVRDVKSDRFVLNLSEAEAENLPEEE